MKRIPRDRRSISPPGPKHLWTGSGTWLAGGMAVVHTAFEKLVNDFTDHLAGDAIQEMEIAGLTVGDREATAVREAIRTLLIDKLLEAMRQQLTDNEATEPDVVSLLRVTITRDMIEVLGRGNPDGEASISRQRP